MSLMAVSVYYPNFGKKTNVAMTLKKPISLANLNYEDVFPEEYANQMFINKGTSFGGKTSESNINNGKRKRREKINISGAGNMSSVEKRGNLGSEPELKC